MHLPSILICPLAQPDFDVLVMGTQLSVSGTGLVPAGQPCGFSVEVMRLHLPFTSLKPSSQPVTFFATGFLAGAVFTAGAVLTMVASLPPPSSTTCPPDCGSTIRGNCPARR